LSKLDLPCGHKVDETAATRVRTDVKNFYTCRKTLDHEGCDPPTQYYSDPFHWTVIAPRNRAVPLPQTPEEQSLREQLAAMVKLRLKRK
jgi:hypothetical protein